MIKKNIFLIIILTLLVSIIGCTSSDYSSIQSENPSNTIETQYTDVPQTEEPIQVPLEAVKESQVVIEERKTALKLVWNYKIQKQSFNIKTGNSLKQGFDEMDSAGIAIPSYGWFSIKEGNRIVVGWIGSIAGFPKLPQWEVKDSIIIPLNGHAITYTPELEPKFEPEFSSERAKKLRDMFNSIIDNEVMPEWERRVDDAWINDTVGALNRWYDEQEEKAMERVAKEFSITVEEADEIYMSTWTESISQGREFADSRGTILTKEEILSLIDEQGSLDI